METKTTHYAITTTNPQGGWRIVGEGQTESEARAAGEREILGDSATADGRLDPYVETEIKNLCVASASAFQRGRDGHRTLPRLTRATWDTMLDRLAER